MLILFDHGTPRGIARSLLGHTVKEARAQGWHRLSNGDLLEAAEKAGFDLLLSTDKNIRYQQNLNSLVIGFVVLRARSNRLEDLQPLVPDILAALRVIKPGDVVHIGSRNR